ncbi:MAG TPA: hypothetical protein VF278_02265 [Pirellulales bacterium]
MEQQLNQLAEKYGNQGYTVIVQPGPDQLPGFARDFQVELLACRKDGNVLVTAKANQADMAADANLPRYAEVIERQPGWRYDLYVLGSDRRMMEERREAPEQSRDDTLKALDDVESMLAGGFAAQSLIAAWAAFESAMRQTLRAHGSRADWETSPRALLNEQVSSGGISIREFQDLERLFDLRNVIAHGFAAPPVERSQVERVIEAARTLLSEPTLAKQTA